MRYILDTSVLLKWFLKEEYSETALQIKEQYINGEVDIIEPDLFLYEFVNALRFNDNITEKEIDEAIEVLFLYQFNIVTPTNTFLKSAKSIALHYGLSVYDAYYVALAKGTGSRFITADKKLIDKVSHFNFVELLSEI